MPDNSLPASASTLFWIFISLNPLRTACPPRLAGFFPPMAQLAEFQISRLFAVGAVRFSALNHRLIDAPTMRCRSLGDRAYDTFRVQTNIRPLTWNKSSCANDKCIEFDQPKVRACITNKVDQTQSDNTSHDCPTCYQERHKGTGDIPWIQFLGFGLSLSFLGYRHRVKNASRSFALTT